MNQIVVGETSALSMKANAAFVPALLPELESLYRSAEARKAILIAHVELLSDAQRNYRQKPGDWSPLQVMDHLVIVEEWMAGTDAPLPSPDSKVQWKGHLFMNLGVGRMRNLGRMPTLPVAAPHDDLDFAAIKARWATTHRLLLPKLTVVTAKTLSRPIALHPVAGPLNAKQVLELMDAHLAYHWHYFPQTNKKEKP